jgi:hypothetical protein
MSVVDEYELVTDRVGRIHSIYPDAQVVLLVDAPIGAATGDWAESPGLQIIHSQEHLYAVEKGGRVVQAHLDAFLRTDARWWFKFDPDTVIRGPFSALPDSPIFFGTVQGGVPGPSLQGGCIGGSRAAVQLLAASGLLLSPELVDFERTWACGNGNLLTRARAGLVSFDFIHAWACRRLAIPLCGHPEIRSEWRQPPRDAGLYAVTHPHKLLDEDAERRLEDARRAVARRIVRLVDDCVPAHANVGVVSKGDDEMTGSRHEARHFPRDEAGGYAGFHPADSEQAISFLETERRAGLDYLVIPDTALWWLEYYPGLARHLDEHYTLVTKEEGAGVIWNLAEVRFVGPPPLEYVGGST